MRIVSGLLATATIFLASPALADQYFLIDIRPHEGAFLDYDSIKYDRETKTAKYWSYIVLENRLLFGPDYMVVKQTANCADETIANNFVASYTLGADKPSRTSDLTSKPKAVIPDTLGAILLKAVCNPDAPKPTMLPMTNVSDIAAHVRELIKAVPPKSK